MIKGDLGSTTELSPLLNKYIVTNKDAGEQREREAPERW